MSAISTVKTGADLIAAFIAERCYPNAFLVTGGACAFIVDAIGRNPKSEFTCFQHEQAAAMAADAIWRTTGKVGVTVVTSGPGATNLITGIACSWFDSIPALHITGQVNQSESREAIGANVRQAGFQETDIVDMVSSITKYSKKIESIEDLIISLGDAWLASTSGRMGPVLLDIPMNIQKEVVTEAQIAQALAPKESEQPKYEVPDEAVENFLNDSNRPTVLIGAGAALAGTAQVIQHWCESLKIPYLSSWGSLAYLDRSMPGYQGSIGVYGSRHANSVIQSADKLVVFGSRLDNRQRTGNPFGFAPFAGIMVFDIDDEELRKYQVHHNYVSHKVDLGGVGRFLSQKISLSHQGWYEKCAESMKETQSGFAQSVKAGELNPYFTVQKLQSKFSDESIVVSDVGANLCWVYQSFLPGSQFLFTAGGNSPMGYSLPAAIGAQLSNPNKDVYCFIGDGGLQMNIQELQTIVHYALPIKIIIQNNFGYGIIKQFQDAYFESRYFATGEGYSIPSFAKIADSYGIPYLQIKEWADIDSFDFKKGPIIIDLHHPSNSLITPKTEMNRFIHDQFPYIEDSLIENLPYKYPLHPSELSGQSNPTV